jgi:hypothetical protein
MHSTTPQDSQYDSRLDEKPQLRATRGGYGRKISVGAHQSNMDEILRCIHDAISIALEGHPMTDRVCFALRKIERRKVPNTFYRRLDYLGERSQGGKVFELFKGYGLIQSEP